MSVVRALTDCIEELERLGGQRELIRDAKAALNAHMDKCRHGGKNVKNRAHRPARPLPWEDILAERKRRVTWGEIRSRLEAAGYRISRRNLMRRYNRYLNATPAERA